MTRIRSRPATTTTVIGGGGGGGGPTGTWAEDATVADNLIVGTVLTEDATIADDLIVMTKLAEDATVDDPWSVPLLLGGWAEDATVNDLLKVQIITVDGARSGTPDNDKMFDGYADQLAANAGTNFGNVNLQAKGTTVTPGSDARNGYIAIDLTDLAGFTAGGPGFTLTFRASQNALLAGTTDTLVWTISRHATKPFTESTMTWNTGRPPAGTAVSNGTSTVAGANTVGTFTATATAAQIAPALGQWLLVAFTAAQAALPNIFTIISRDQAANRPTWTLDHIQRGS